MKIKAQDGQELSSLTKQAQAEETARIDRTFIGDMLAKNSRGSGGDRVSLDLGRSIAHELQIGVEDPERAERIAKLKERISKGDYHPDPELVAAAVSSDISLEVLTSQLSGFAGNNDDDDAKER